jgi:3'-phosphoadenosine 5'-phosphosulfate sulfotransferase (PAPS reductase)/FAD synthetase
MVKSINYWRINESKRVISTALNKWGKSIGIAFTGRKDSSVMMKLIMSQTDKVPKAFFIDHGLHFKESYEQINKLINLWNLDVDYAANHKLLKKLKREKNKENKSEIIAEFKIHTIRDIIRKYKWKALFTAIRWDENPARSKEKYFSKRNGHYRVHPMLHWEEGDIWDYIKANDIPYNQLYDIGYRSIGSKIFTSKSKKGERSGREKEKENIMDRLRSLGYF